MTDRYETRPSVSKSNANYSLLVQNMKFMVFYMFFAQCTRSRSKQG